MTDKDRARPSDQALASQAQGLGPSGFDPSRYIMQTIGGIIDQPSLYMGGASRDALRKAEYIWRFICTDAIAMEAFGRDAQRLGPKGDSAGREASPEDSQ